MFPVTVDSGVLVASVWIIPEDPGPTLPRTTVTILVQTDNLQGEPSKLFVRSAHGSLDITGSDACGSFVRSVNIY